GRHRNRRALSPTGPPPAGLCRPGPRIGRAAGDGSAGRSDPLTADVSRIADRAGRARGPDRLAARRRGLGHTRLMEREQYDLMYAQEERHWWYVGMRRISAALLERYPARVRRGAGCPPRILDAGCGSGGMTRFLSKYGAVTGVDL